MHKINKIFKISRIKNKSMYSFNNYKIMNLNKSMNKLKINNVKLLKKSTTIKLILKKSILVKIA